MQTTTKTGEIFQSVNTRNALFAPLAASASLFGTYYLLKNNFDIATVYQVRLRPHNFFYIHVWV